MRNTRVEGGLIALIAMACCAVAPAQSSSINIWSEVTEARPPTDRIAMCYDSARDRIVLFGGGGQTWEWGGAWVQRTPLNTPPAASGFELAFDAARGVSVLFGGNDAGSSSLDQTWIWDGNDWTQLSPTTSPSPRLGHALVYDSIRQRTVLFGGRAGVSGPELGDTWEWDGATWTRRSTGAAPSRRSFVAAAFDMARGRVVLHGGSDGTVGGPLDTWEWDGTDWLLRSPATVPPWNPYGENAMAYDVSRGRTVLFMSGTATPMWEWDGQDWTHVMSAVTGVPRVAASLVYVAQRAKVTLFGGGTFGPSPVPVRLSEWDGATWTPIASNPFRAPVYDHALAYDSSRSEIVSFGGIEPPDFGRGLVDETWVWDGTGWTRRFAANAPTARGGHALVEDAARQQLVLFGGRDASGVQNDTWTWNGIDWTQRAAAMAPSAREQHAIAYDTSRDVVVLFGGLDSVGTRRNDTWEWDGAQWHARVTAHVPPRFDAPSMTYDIARAEVLLAGTPPQGGFELWSFDGNDWSLRISDPSPLSSQTSPTASIRATFVHDPVRGFSYWFGGASSASGGGSASVWSWTGSGFVWLDRLTGFPVLEGRADHGFAYDAARDLFVAFGGRQDLLFPLWVDSRTWSYAAQQLALFRAFGAGCQGSAGVPTLVAGLNDAVRVGQTVRFEVRNLPASRLAVPFGLIGFENVAPIDLSSLAMPGCSLLVAPRADVTLTNRLGFANWDLACPLDAGLAGVSVFLQALVVDAPANPFGLVWSDGAECVIGF